MNTGVTALWYTFVQWCQLMKDEYDVTIIKHEISLPINFSDKANYLCAVSINFDSGNTYDKLAYSRRNSGVMWVFLDIGSTAYNRLYSVNVIALGY